MRLRTSQGKTDCSYIIRDSLALDYYRRIDLERLQHYLADFVDPCRLHKALRLQVLPEEINNDANKILAIKNDGRDF